MSGADGFPSDAVQPSRQATTLDEARAAAREFLGVRIENVTTGVEATLSGNNLRKMTSDSAVRKSSSAMHHALAVANADWLFASALSMERGPDARGEPTILAISRWVAMLATVGGAVAVKITVKETADPSAPNPLYTIQTIRVEPAR